ncbi:hypothetical protein EPO44_12100 [bacterium]|nr:MAG: hypothetical protein EPO44_12100 [bacterium]
MLKGIILFAIVVGLLLCPRRSREWLLEEVKAISDLLVIFLLRSTSQFGSELTADGKAEQNLWREQRLRNLRGLTLRSRQRWEKKTR